MSAKLERRPINSILLFCTLLPSSIVPGCVEHGKNNYSVRSNNEENPIGESSSENATNRWILANTCKGFGIL